MDKIHIEEGRLEYAIGLNSNSAFVGRYRTYKAYRNGYSVARGRRDDKIEYLVNQGLMAKRRNRLGLFYVTENGYKYLEKKYGIRIQRYEKVEKEEDNAFIIFECPKCKKTYFGMKDLHIVCEECSKRCKELK